MTSKNEVIIKLAKIKAKLTLGLPINTYENALWVLYSHLLEGAV